MATRLFRIRVVRHTPTLPCGLLHWRGVVIGTVAYTPIAHAIMGMRNDILFYHTRKSLRQNLRLSVGNHNGMLKMC